MAKPHDASARRVFLHRPKAMTSNPPVNADARDVPAHAVDRAARAGYRARYAASDTDTQGSLSTRDGRSCWHV